MNVFKKKDQQRRENFFNFEFFLADEKAAGAGTQVSGNDDQ